MVLLTELELLPGFSSSSSTRHDNHNYRYGVFLSFRSVDTRNSFTDHLYNALVDADIITFLDDEELETGEKLKPELESAIKSSRASIIVLSKNYASSTWCLEELVLILEQNRNFNQIVIPIFYHVSPTNMQQSNIVEAMAKHKHRTEAETNAEIESKLAQKMESWKRALTQVANLKGKDAKNRTRYGIRNLIDRCLLSIRDNKLMMHQLVQEMGRDLVRQESIDKPSKRTRLWCHEESFKVLKHKKSKRNLLGLALDMRLLDKKKLRGSFELEKDSLRKMDNLMLLQLNYVQLNGCFRTFPEELRWLCMHGFPLKSIRLDLPMKNLVYLDMSFSNITAFDMYYSNSQPPSKRQKLVGSWSKGERLLGSLKILDLSFCKNLHSLGGFLEIPALERLIVVNCVSLIVVCKSLDQCVELIHIDLSYCLKLKRLPVSIGKLKKVQTLLLDGCNFSESQIEMWDTNSLDISINSQTSSSTIVDTIPSDVKFFVSSLPSSLIVLSLANNNLSNESFPGDFSCLLMLEELCLDDNPIISMPKCVRSLPKLKKLCMENCEMVISIEHPPCTLKVLSVGHRNTSLRKIKFNPEMSSLKIDGPWKLLSPSSYEIDGMVKIQPLACVEEKVLHSLGWKNLDFIKERRLKTCTFGGSDKSQTKMYYEFGIFSTMYYEKKGMPNWIKNTRKGPSISFTIPSSPKKIRGLNFCYVETMRRFSYNTFVLPMIKISNITKEHTWIYNHYIDKVKVEGKFLNLLSHWMFGPDEMTTGDQITINVTQRYCKEQFTKKCGVNVMFDDGKNDEEDELGYYKSWNHIIGGDLFAFRTTNREYLLSSMHFFDGSRYKEKEVSFKAFSQKRSKIIGDASEDTSK